MSSSMISQGATHGSCLRMGRAIRVPLYICIVVAWWFVAHAEFVALGQLGLTAVGVGLRAFVSRLPVNWRLLLLFYCIC